jgi:hypothetical protein
MTSHRSGQVRFDGQTLNQKSGYWLDKSLEDRGVAEAILQSSSSQILFDLVMGIRNHLVQTVLTEKYTTDSACLKLKSGPTQAEV